MPNECVMLILREIQELLGHKSVETTMIYMHVVRVNPATEIVKKTTWIS